MAAHVVRCRDEAAENDDIEAIRDEFGDVVRDSFELWIAALTRELLGLRNEAGQRRIIGANRRLDVILDERVSLAVEDAIKEVFAGFVAKLFSSACT
jgi:hypothetical protein